MINKNLPSCLNEITPRLVVTRDSQLEGDDNSSTAETGQVREGASV